jgi:hypothetical protein
MESRALGEGKHFVAEEAWVFVILGSRFTCLFYIQRYFQKEGQIGGMYEVRKPQEIKFRHTVTG